MTHAFTIRNFRKYTRTPNENETHTQEPKKARLWGGRFRTDTDPVMEKFNDSLRFDRCMWAEDIQGSEAYAKALVKTGILSDVEAKDICEGLDKVRAEWAAGEFVVVVSYG